MSKADSLGAAPAFGQARGARSSRRNAIERTIGADNAAAAAITELPVTLVSENPDNPRNHLRNLDETVETVREVGIILPIVVATVEAYLHDRPDRASDLDDGAHYVVVDGHRRLEAARRVGLATIPVRVDNARVATDEALLEAAFVANYHRDDMTDLEEAHALKQLVDYYGSQTKASKRLGIPQNTISSKLSLLKLTPELQKDLMTGARTVEHVRNLGKLSPEEQKAKADERAERARARSASSTPVVKRESKSADYHGVIIPEAGHQDPDTAESGPQPVPPTPAVPRASEGGPPESSREGIPEPRPESPAQPAPLPEGRKLPYDQGATVGRHLAVRMEIGPFLDATQVMVDQCWEKAGPEASLKLLRGLLSTASQRCPSEVRKLLDEVAALHEEAADN